MRSKKAMSPLIATVLLIAFAVALGAMIMNWSADVQPVDSKTPPSNPSAAVVDPCSAVSIELQQVFGKDLFCYQGENIRFNVINTGSKEISGIQLRTVDANLQQLNTDLQSSGIPIGGSFEKLYPLAVNDGKVHAELVPFVVYEGKPAYCVKKKIVQDTLLECGSE